MVFWLEFELQFVFLSGDDVLVKITCISMLADFASVCTEAFNFLVQTGMISEINKSLKSLGEQQGPFDGLFHAGESLCILLILFKLI